MMYLSKKTSEKDCKVGDNVMVLADFSGVPAGTRGEIVEVNNGGVMVQWTPRNQWEEARPLRDGFTRDELKYLAFVDKW